MDLETAEDLLNCECGHSLDTHNGLGCYERLQYQPELIICDCKLTDDRTEAELLLLNLPKYIEEQVAAEHTKWVEWLHKINYGIDWRIGEPDPPCSLRELAALWAADDTSADTEDYMWTIEQETGNWKGDRT